MKTQLFSTEGKKLKDIELPKIFSSKIREDFLKRAYEAEKIWQPYSHNPMAGKRQSASGTISHKRHDWKGHYGKGMSRIPRKTMWRRGTQFYWVGAEISSARGGRRAHGPKGSIPLKKINKKEYALALESAIASTANKEKILKRYSRIKEVKNDLPIVIDSNFSELKTKNIDKSINSILGDLKVISSKEKSIRAGKGKFRNRKYKKPARILIVTGNDEKLKARVLNQIKVMNLTVSDLYPAGRVVIYTESAIKDLDKLKK